MDRHQEMSIDGYIDAQRENIDSIKNLPQFSILGSLVHQFYEISRDSVPSNSPQRFGRCLILCHRSFLAAITLIGQGQPEDAAPITRRAVEIGKLCLGLKFKPQNFEKWLDYEKRMKRWEAREKGTRLPPYSTPKINLPENHIVLNEFNTFLGVLSDSYVHFTPEFDESQNWRVTSEGESVFFYLNYFISDQRIIERELILLADAHGYIILIFNECLDDVFRKNSKWKNVFDKFLIASERLKTQYAQKCGIKVRKRTS